MRASFSSPIALFLPRLLHLLSPPILRSPVRPSRESTYGCSFGNHIFFVSQFAAPLNALPPFRRGCISVAAARYKFWRRQRALDGVGEETRKDGERRGEEKSKIQGEKRRRKIGPMVIDYLPCIPRIPYSDRPHGPKIEPSITGALFSFSLYPLFILSFPLLSLPLPFHPLSLDLLPRGSPESVGALVYFLAPRDEGRNPGPRKCRAN